MAHWNESANDAASSVGATPRRELFLNKQQSYANKRLATGRRSYIESSITLPTPPIA